MLENITLFDIYSLSLVMVSITLFVYRYIKQNPPVYPYLIISLTCLAANWLGESGGGVFALALLVAASFSFLGCLLYPSWREMSQANKSAAPTSPQS